MRILRFSGAASSVLTGRDKSSSVEKAYAGED
jgi:hypothetical protein